MPHRIRGVRPAGPADAFHPDARIVDASTCDATTVLLFCQFPSGESFYFRVNGIPIFIKGANLIPLSIMRTDVTMADWRTLRDAALGAHMNMLRVWGGGLYQVRDFPHHPSRMIGCDTRAHMHMLRTWGGGLYQVRDYPHDIFCMNGLDTCAHMHVLRVWGGGLYQVRDISSPSFSRDWLGHTC